jgi:hypothetical protein
MLVHVRAVSRAVIFSHCEELKHLFVRVHHHRRQILNIHSIGTFANFEFFSLRFGQQVSNLLVVNLQQTMERVNSSLQEAVSNVLIQNSNVLTNEVTHLSIFHLVIPDRHLVVVLCLASRAQIEKQLQCPVENRDVPMKLQNEPTNEMLASFFFFFFLFFYLSLSFVFVLDSRFRLRVRVRVRLKGFEV